MSKVPEIEPLEVNDAVDPLEFYVAALILWADDMGITVEQGHEDVTEYLKDYRIDIDLDLNFLSPSGEDTLH